MRPNIDSIQRFSIRLLLLSLLFDAPTRRDTNRCERETDGGRSRRAVGQERLTDKPVNQSQSHNNDNHRATVTCVYELVLPFFHSTDDKLRIKEMTTPATTTEDFGIGCVLHIKTTLGEEFEGQVIAFDRHSNMLALQESSSAKLGGPRMNLRLLKANYIKEFTFLGLDDDPMIDPKSFYVDLNTLQAKEDSAIRQAELDAQRIGVGVTAEAQNLFDALSKTHPVRWDQTTIVVMNEIRVCSPYLPDCVTGGTPAANDRVRKVLELERRRLQSRGGASQ